MKEKIMQRMAELQGEIRMHQGRASQAQQILNAETEQILAKQGAILEFQKLLKEETKAEEKPETKAEEKPETK